jgi:hypothetical protein
MLERPQAQHDFGGRSLPAAVAAARMTFGQSFVGQCDQLFVVQDPIQLAHPVFPAIVQPLLQERLGESGG